MRKLLFIVTLFLLNISFVCAECSDEDISRLKKESQNIEIKYELQENVEGEFGIETAVFDLIISNIGDGFVVRDDYYNYDFSSADIDSNGNIRLKAYVDGEHEFEIYSTQCDKLLRTEKIDIPRFNPYSEDPLCDGISGEELDVCDVWYKYELDYDTFKDKVEKYKNGKVTNDDDVKDENIFENITSFLMDNLLYILVSVTLVIAILVIIIVKRKRSALE